jgi:kumamolisin
MEATGDRQINVQAKARELLDASALLSREANLNMDGPVGGLQRVAVTTFDGIAQTPRGIYNAAAYDLQHPLEIVKTVAGSAVMAAALKVVLPEAGPVGKVAGLAMGAWFIAGTAPAFIGAYRNGLNARTWSQMHAAGQEWGNAAGQLAVNSTLGMAGYKIGAGLAGNILARESFDNFADLKQNFWDSTSDQVKRLLCLDSSVPTAASVGLQPNVAFDGDRVRLKDSLHKSNPTGQVLGPADGNADMNATVMLRSKASVLRMDRYIARMSEGKAAMLGDEGDAFAQRFGARPESLAVLKDFAGKYNLNIAESDLRSGRVLLTGKTADFQRAFEVELKTYAAANGPITGYSGALSLPRELSAHVQSVLGIDERPVAAPAYRVRLDDGSSGLSGSSADSFIKQGGYTAVDIARAQNFPLASGGEGQHGAFISLGGGIDQADYNKFFPAHGLEQPKPLQIVLVDGARNSPGNPLAGDTENALDAIQIQSVAPKAELKMILGPNNDQGLVDVFERAIFPKNGEAANSVVSASWGLAEHKQSTQAVNALTIAFRKAAIRGVQIVAGAGDSGAMSHALTFQPEFPACDPNVTGVGGLKMVLDEKGQLSSAVAWDEGELSSTGGGVSKIFRQPWWQKDAGVPTNPDTGKIGRGVPDISTNAARATGFPVRVGGQDLVIGGTSAGAPLYAGLLLNINSELATAGIKPVTPLNPWMYARAQSGVFQDVTAGGNHGFQAGKGWDAVSGLGWVDGQSMLQAMKANQTAYPAR